MFNPIIEFSHISFRSFEKCTKYNIIFEDLITEQQHYYPIGNKLTKEFRKFKNQPYAKEVVNWSQILYYCEHSQNLTNNYKKYLRKRLLP